MAKYAKPDKASLKAAVSVAEQAASVVILCEPQWKLSTEEQDISRAYRMGQKQKVMVHRLLSENSIDERMLEVLKGKSDIFNSFAQESVAGGIGFGKYGRK